eukprot:243761_1
MSRRSHNPCSTPKVKKSTIIMNVSPRTVHSSISASSFTQSNTITPREYSSSLLGSPQYNPSTTNTDSPAVIEHQLDTDDRDWTADELVLPMHITHILAQYPSNKQSTTRPTLTAKKSVHRHKNTLFSYSPHHNYKTQNFMTIS